MQDISRDRATVLGGVWVGETILAGVLAGLAWQFTTPSTLVAGLAVAFAVIHVLGFLVWTHRVHLPGGIHHVQVLVRFAFYVGLTIHIGLAAPRMVKLSLVVLTPLALVVAYWTDYVWYEATIAP